MVRKTEMKIVLGLAVFIICIIPLTVFAGSIDSVRVAIPSYPVSANILRPTKGTLIFNWLLYQSVLTINPKTGEYMNGLAEEIKVLPNQRDVLVKLRKGPKFTTGDPVKAQDVKFTHNQVANSGGENIFFLFSQLIKGYEIVDDYTYIVHFKEPCGPWRLFMLGGVCSKKYYERVSAREFHDKPVGSGPFRLVKTIKGEKYVLEAVEDHHDTKVDYKTLELISVPDETTRLAMLETDEIDLVCNILPHQLGSIDKNPSIKIKRTDQYPSMIGVVTNLRQFPIMEDKKLRMAMQIGVNREEIVEQVLMGEGYPLYHDASKIEMGYDPNFKFEFNPEKARKLVKESNYKPGTPLIMAYNQSVPMAGAVSEIFQRYMEEIGVTIKLQKLEPGVMRTYYMNKDKRLGHMFIYSFAPDVDPHFRLMLSIVSASPYNPFPNRPDQDKIDALCFAQAREVDPKKRLVILKNIQTLLNKDLVSVKLFGINMIYAMRDHIDYTWVPKASVLTGLCNIKIVDSVKATGLSPEDYEVLEDFWIGSSIEGGAY